MKNFKYFFSGLFVVLASVGLVGTVMALPSESEITNRLSQIKYPIAELGNCTDQGNCELFCEKTENMSICLDYAEKQSLVSSEELLVAKKAVSKIQAGETPGKCKTKQECQNFCENNVTNIKECLGFANEIGVPESELGQARKVALALERGGEMPGGCTGKNSCETYCADTTHIDECLNFAEKAEMFSASDIAEARKVAPFLKSGETPGKCQTKNDCKVYCDDSNHFEECITFAEKTGLVSKEDAEMAKKAGGNGPGNCKNKIECMAYCNNQAHADECANFAIQRDLVDEKTKDLIQNGVSQMKQALDSAPSEAKVKIEACLNGVFEGNLSGVLNGSYKITQEKGDLIQPCFENSMKEYAETQKQAAMGGASFPITPPAGMGSVGTNQTPPSTEQIQAQIQAQMPKNIPTGVTVPSPEEIQKQIQAQIPKDIPTSIPPTPSTDVPTVPTGVMPANIPVAPVGVQMAPPTNIPTGGPPCSSEAECRAMFGGGQ